MERWFVSKANLEIYYLDPQQRPSFPNIIVELDKKIQDIEEQFIDNVIFPTHKVCMI